MANTYRWFRIGEANAEIERLEKALAEANTKLSEATSATSANESDLADQAATLKAEVDRLNQSVSALTMERDSAIADAARARASVNTEAANKAATITAQVGVPAVTSSAATATVAAKPDFRTLVSSQVAAGKTKAEAVAFCVKNHTAEYLEWRKTGNTQTL